MNNLLFITPYHILIVLAIISIYVFSYVSYIKTIKGLNKELSDNNRRVNDSNLWIIIIPVIGSLYHFYIVNEIYKSLKNEEHNENIQIPYLYYGKWIGHIACLLGLFPKVFILYCFFWFFYWGFLEAYRKGLIELKVNLRTD